MTEKLNTAFLIVKIVTHRIKFYRRNLCKMSFDQEIAELQLNHR